MLTRRGVLGGLVAALAAPAIIRTPGLLMPVRPVALASDWEEVLVTMEPGYDWRERFMPSELQRYGRITHASMDRDTAARLQAMVARQLGRIT